MVAIPSLAAAAASLAAPLEHLLESNNPISNVSAGHSHDRRFHKSAFSCGFNNSNAPLYPHQVLIQNAAADNGETYAIPTVIHMIYSEGAER